MAVSDSAWSCHAAGWISISLATLVGCRTGSPSSRSVFRCPSIAPRLRARMRSSRLGGSLGGDPGRQFQNPDVPEVDLRPFRLQAEISFLLRRAAEAIYELAVYRKLHHAIHCHHVVDVPFTAPLAAILDRHTPLAAR